MGNKDEKKNNMSSRVPYWQILHVHRQKTLTDQEDD